MYNIAILGASGHARVVEDIINLEGKYKIAGIISPQTETLSGIDYLGVDDDIVELVKKYNLVGGIIAIGDNNIRKNIAEKISRLCPDFLFITAIHPSAIIAKTVSLGAGTMVMAGAIINPYTTVGKHCILNTNSTIEHDNIIGDFVHIAPSVTMCGNVKIHTGAMIGVGTNIIPNITVGENSVIGAGSLVCCDLPENIVCYGVPARIIRKKD
ncbi:MAG: acetyltransferase [Rickettsiales bacterium]|jgi:sugar O-acyltransferase (sialic acid O-acetyltransferase NeuD family)